MISRGGKFLFSKMVNIPEDEIEHSKKDNVEPIYSGYATLNNYGINASSGTTIKMTLTGYDDSLSHPFKGLKTGSISGCRMRLIITVLHEDGEKTYYNGESILNGWSEQHNTGMSVSLRIEDQYNGKDTHPLTGLRPGKTTGDNIYVACWALGDDELLEDAKIARKKARPWHTLDATSQSNIKCNDYVFQNWCLRNYTILLPDNYEGMNKDDIPVKFAGELVRRYCNVESRRILRLDTEEGIVAKSKWLDLLHKFEIKNPS